MAISPKRLSDRKKEEALEDTPDGRIVREAKDRFKRAMAWEWEFRKLYTSDVKFNNGDSDNGWQWPTDLKQTRDVNKRPCLTINKTQNHVGEIVNEGKKNPPSISIKPVGNNATFKGAQAWEGLVRNIEYRSMAQVVYSEAALSQVEGGIGYWRVNTRYADEGSGPADRSMFDQEIIIEPFQDHLGVLLDCDIKQKDGSDAMWGFTFEAVNKDEFERQHPEVDLPSTASASELLGFDGWITSEDVRVAEYYRIITTDDELIDLEIPGGKPATFYRSDIPRTYRKALKEAEAEKSNTIRRRKIRRKKLEWYKIAGKDIIDRKELAGTYIPLIRLPGRERVIDGKLERKGLVRTLKDPQRIYNYNSSGSVEFGALQTKTPWIVAAASVEGNQGAWNTANTTNAAYLTYKHKDDTGQPLPAPQRTEPPGSSPAFLDGLKIAAAEMEMASGQYRPQQENPSLERTPKAIDQRERLSATATFDFVFNLSMAIRHTAKVIIDLGPHVYDTERIIKILGKDGKQTDVKVNPTAQADYTEADESSADVDEAVEAIFNPTVGKYEVQGDIGPAFGTQRQEAWNAMAQIFGAQPEFMQIGGDLMFGVADFHMADKLAERFKRHIKATAPYLLDDDAVTPQVQQLQGELQKQQQYVGELLQKLAENKLRLKGKEEMRDIDVFKAQTDRLTAQGNVVDDFSRLDPSIQSALQKTVMETLASMGFDLSDVIQANKPALDAQEDGANGQEFGGIASEAPGGVKPTGAGDSGV